METIGSKRSYALTWCMPNNDDDDDSFNIVNMKVIWVNFFETQCSIDYSCELGNFWNFLIIFPEISDKLKKFHISTPYKTKY